VQAANVDSPTAALTLTIPHLAAIHRDVIPKKTGDSNGLRSWRPCAKPFADTRRACASRHGHGSRFRCMLGFIDSRCVTIEQKAGDSWPICNILAWSFGVTEPKFLDIVGCVRGPDCPKEASMPQLQGVCRPSFVRHLLCPGCLTPMHIRLAERGAGDNSIRVQ
jgi:hypothetical protein